MSAALDGWQVYVSLASFHTHPYSLLAPTSVPPSASILQMFWGLLPPPTPPRMLSPRPKRCWTAPSTPSSPRSVILRPHMCLRTSPAALVGPAACQAFSSGLSRCFYACSTTAPFIWRPLPSPAAPRPDPLCADNPSVDIGDIATAHVLAMVTPEARGRYIICSGPSTLPEAAAILRWAAGRPGQGVPKDDKIF